MNLQELHALFRFDVPDAAPPYSWPVDRVTYWLNEAEDEAALRARLLFDSSLSYAVIAGTRTVAYTERLIDVTHAHLVLGGAPVPLRVLDRMEADRLYPNRRDISGTPKALIHEEGYFSFDVAADAAAVLKVEAYRYPSAPLAQDTDEPEILADHHRHLIEWAKYRAYSLPAEGLQDLKRAAQSLALFESYFGLRPMAKARKAAAANRPQRNKVW